MDKLKLFPLLTAEPIQEYNKSKTHLYLYSSRNNRGYSLDGFAANLCHRFDGTKNLETIIQDFETDMSLEKNYYQDEIVSLLLDLQNNSLVDFLEQPKSSKSAKVE